jgi:cytochrome P450
MVKPEISPMPPVAASLGMPWDVPVDDPVESLAGAREALGDTFVIDSGDDRFLFTFSAVGVAAFYALPEERASKGVADWRMLRRKLPDELFVDRRTLPHQLFRRDDVAGYLGNVERALDATVEELGRSGETDLFGLTRRLGHRIGLASWGGPNSAGGARFDRLAQAFDALDGAESFVHPDAMAAVEAGGKRAERLALGAIVEELGQAVRELPRAESDYPLFARIVQAWSDQPAESVTGGVALDVTLIHVASMSNLFAALAWALIDLLAHPEQADRVQEGDRVLAESCALESVRLGQCSIMARYVLRPVSMDVGGVEHQVAPGVTIATLLPLTNTSAAPGLEAWDPNRWKGRRLADSSQLAAAELVTSFGHGRHTCPAQAFSLSAMTAATTRILAEFDLDPGWTLRPSPVRAQIGGVARAAEPCMVRYRRRSSPSSA